MADVTLLDYLRTYLIAKGIVRDPQVAGSLPPVWRQPRNGTYAPGETPQNGTASEAGTDAVVALYLAPGIPAPVMDQYLRVDGVDIELRVAKSPTGISLERQIRGALIGQSSDGPDKQLNWDMAGLRVIASQEWRPFQFLHSDEQAYDYRLSYIFERYAT